MQELGLGLELGLFTMPAPFEAIERSVPGPMPRHSARTPLAATICRMIDTLDIPRYLAPSLLLEGHRQWSRRLRAGSRAPPQPRFGSQVADPAHPGRLLERCAATWAAASKATSRGQGATLALIHESTLDLPLHCTRDLTVS